MSDFVRFSNSQRKASGAHYTPKLFAKFVAEHLGRAFGTGTPHVLDPAAGDGELLSAILREFNGNARATGFDTDKWAIATAKLRIEAEFPQTRLELHCEDFLSVALNHRDGGLFAPKEKFDIVISNPPYVRTQVLGATRAQELARQFNLDGRVDLYFAFIEGIAEVLRPGGIAGVIVSNRFMTTRAGAAVRKRIVERFEILHVWDLGDTRLFEAAVLPAVLLLRKRDEGQEQDIVSSFSSIYTAEATAPAKATTIFDALKMSGLVRVNEVVFKVVHGTLDYGHESGAVWRLATEASDQWLETVLAHTCCTFGQIGKIRVGVKTTADKVFVRKDWKVIPESERPEVLRPLITHHVARRFRSFPADRKIAYTHEDRNGKRHPISLDSYPRTARYFEAHREALEGREYVMASGRQWFEIWVPQQPSLWSSPKLVFPDISEKPTFWMSLENEVIQGDCYWIPAETPEQLELLWLAVAVANSRFIEEFYDHACRNKLYAGRRRFMTQYVERFPIPDPKTDLAKKIVEKAKEIFELTPSVAAERLADELEDLVQEAFGVSKEDRTQRNLQLAI